MPEIIKEISVTEAAGRLGVSRQRVLTLIKEARLCVRRAGHLYAIREKDLALLGDRKRGRPAGVKDSRPRKLSAVSAAKKRTAKAKS